MNYVVTTDSYWSSSLDYGGKNHSTSKRGEELILYFVPDNVQYQKISITL